MIGSPELFALFQSIDYAAIKRMVDGREVENIHTEFKRWSKEHFRKHLAKALSGFSMADGGIIVWGVDTEPGPDGADRAKAEVPIADPDALRVNMQAVTVNAAEPPVPGVEHRVVVHPGGGGFVLTFIPASDGGPHMAKADLNRFYRRDDIGHHPMGQAELADAFGRQPRPSLELVQVGIKGTVERNLGPQDGYGAFAEMTCRVLLELENRGRGLARFPAVRLRLTPQDSFALDTKYPPTLTQSPSPVEPRMIVLLGGANNVVHSGTQLHLAAISTIVHLRYVGESVKAHPDVSDLTIECTLSAEGVQPKTSMMVIKGSDILAAALGTPHAGGSVIEWFERPEIQYGRPARPGSS